MIKKMSNYKQLTFLSKMTKIKRKNLIHMITNQSVTILFKLKFTILTKTNEENLILQIKTIIKEKT